jgi:hypothetical protein
MHEDAEEEAEEVWSTIKQYDPVRPSTTQYDPVLQYQAISGTGIVGSYNSTMVGND